MKKLLTALIFLTVCFGAKATDYLCEDEAEQLTGWKCPCYRVYAMTFKDLEDHWDYRLVKKYKAKVYWKVDEDKEGMKPSTIVYTLKMTYPNGVN